MISSVNFEQKRVRQKGVELSLLVQWKNLMFHLCSSASKIFRMDTPAKTDSLTTSQRDAVRTRGNVLVMAGAGTGKTRTLAISEEQASLAFQKACMGISKRVKCEKQRQ
jgi:hypothetical protein